MTKTTTALALAGLLVAAACSGSGDGSGPDAAPTTTVARGAEGALPLRGPTAPTEHVGLTAQTPIDRQGFDALAGGLFGDAAAEGDVVDDYEVGAGLHLSSAPHPESSAQVALTVALDTTGAEPPTRTVAAVPASLATGATFIDAVDAALAQVEVVRSEDPEGLAPWRLEYRSRSAQGGQVTVAVVFEPATGAALELSAQGPTTSLAEDSVNRPATEGAPYETVYGLVWFDVSRDQFDFFANRAYGISAGKAQNFKDFELVPHSWLRLTVTPELDQDRVDVAFDVVTVDGRRIPVARAPASLVAGEQFMQTVFRMAEDTAAQEEAQPGSSTPWEVPFYYDDPEGGGVVEVIAQGRDGTSRIAYSIESPASPLDDLPFVPYEGTVEVPDDWDAPPPDCADLGHDEADEGRLEVTYQASSTVQGSDLKAPLRGTIYGSVFRARDVKISGPVDGAEPVASVRVPDVDVAEGPSDPVPLDVDLPAGDYQILGFLDIDGDADPDDPSPDEGDPVMIPIGGYTLACDVQPVTAELAILLPPGVG